MKKVTESVFYVGVNDHNVDLFEGQYRVPQGMSYNSYVIMDEKIAVMDTVLSSHAPAIQRCEFLLVPDRHSSMKSDLPVLLWMKMSYYINLRL